ncbi:MAG TPA: hypothetical protein VG942_17900 [Hyphomonadaceae bacterium]|nr:hypothetical protein [Hyphomonadaceae bacterium]
MRISLGFGAVAAPVSAALVFITAGAAVAQGLGFTGDARYDAAYRRFTEEVRAADGALRDVATLKPDAPMGPKTEACAKASRATSMFAIALSDGRSLPSSASVGPTAEMELAAEVSKVETSARKAKDAKTLLCKGEG